MSANDRTAEFRQAVESAVARSGVLVTQPLFAGAPRAALDRRRAGPSGENESLLGAAAPDPGDADPLPPGRPTKSEFAHLAAGIGRDINTALAKLAQLTQLARRQTLFDDKPLEINQLIYAIKQDIGRVNASISGLQAFSRQQSQTQHPHKQAQEHSALVIASLQTRLASTSKEFKDVLELRTQNMREAKSRKDLFVGGEPTAGASGPAAAADAQAFANSPLFHPRRGHAAARRSSGAAAAPASADLVLNLGSGSVGAAEGGEQSLLLPAGGAQTQLSRDMSSTYYSQRATAIESIESTIAELGQVYQHFAQILAGQREMIQRIDDNVQDTEMNVVGAHNELLRYYENMTSNRWLMVKVFGVIIFFFVLFVLFM